MNMHDWALFMMAICVVAAVLSFGGYDESFVANQQVIKELDYEYLLESGDGNEDPTEESSYGKSIVESKSIIAQVDSKVFAIAHFIDQIFGTRDAAGSRTATSYATLLMRGMFTYIYAWLLMEVIRGYRAA